MIRLPRASLLVIALAVVLPLGAAGESQQDSWTGVERIVAIGDVHGDFKSFVKILRAAGVIDEQNAWSGGKTHLVQTGDIVDRGPDSRKAMDLLRRLEAEALETGGRVHALIGNHEAALAVGYLAYAHRGESEAFGGEKAFLEALGPNGEYGKWIRSHNACIRINGILFLHAGIPTAYTRYSLRELNNLVRTQLATARTGDTGILMDPAAPLWYRGYALLPDRELNREIALVLSTYRATRVVAGHNVVPEGIRTRCGGRIVMIDVGLSQFYVGGPLECLVIEKGKLWVVTPDRRRELPPIPGMPAVNRWNLLEPGAPKQAPE